MNKEKVQAAMDDLKVKQDLFLLSKLEEEYNELSDKCNKLYTYIYSLDFMAKVPDCDERCLMQEQHKRMESYRTNLYQRIDFYRCRVKTACGYDALVPWSEVAKKEQSSSLGAIDAFVYAINKLKEKIAESDNHVSALLVPKLTAMYRLYHDILEILADNTNHCGQDAVNEEQLPDNLQDTYKDYCRGVLEQFLSREITWAKFVEKVALPFCHENINEFVNAIKEGRSDSGQDATCQVGDGSAVVEKPIITGESLQQLIGYQVIAVCKPGSKCNGCPYEHYNAPCVKVEIVGGFFLCLAPLPNSIVTE